MASPSHFIGTGIGWLFFQLPALILKKAGFYALPIVARLVTYATLSTIFMAGTDHTIFNILILTSLLTGITELLHLTIRDTDKNANHLRGNELVETKTVEKMLSGEDSRFELGSVRFPKRFETRHILVAGTTGAGKTRLFHQILQPSRKTNARAVIVDIGGAMVSRYWQPGDIILNPRDARSVPWSPLAEIEAIDDIPLVAKSIIPDGQGSNGEWNQYAQRLLAGVLQRAWEAGSTNGEIIRLLTSAPVEELRDLLAGLPAEGMLRDGNERMFSSVMAIISSYVVPLSSLPADAGADAFSVTKFIADNGTKSWLFLNFTDRQIELLKPIITAVISTAIASQLSLKEDPDRRILFVLDEFDALGEVAGIKRLLTRGRRFGGVAIIAVQSVSQLYELYGRDVGNTLMSNLGTQVILRLPDSETAEWASRLFGDEQIVEEQYSNSSSEFGSDKSTSVSYQTRQQRVVMASEIQNLPDLVGLLNIVGDIPPCPIRIPPLNPPQVHPEFQKVVA